MVQGHLYQLDQHLRRFLASAAKANVPLPHGLTVDQMRRTILETAAASCKMNGERERRSWLDGRRLWAAKLFSFACTDGPGTPARGVQVESGTIPAPNTHHQKHTMPPPPPALPLPCSAGHVRYWLSAGRGGFGLSGNECLGAAFYCVVYTHELPDEKLDGAYGWQQWGGAECEGFVGVAGDTILLS